MRTPVSRRRLGLGLPDRFACGGGPQRLARGRGRAAHGVDAFRDGAQLFEQAGDLAQFVGGAVERVFEQRRQRLRELGAQACAGGVGAGGELARDRAAAAHDVREAGAVGDVGERVRPSRQLESLLETGGLRAVPGVGEHAGVHAVEQRRAGLLPGDRVADPRDRLLGLDGRGGGAERVAVGLVRAAELLEPAVLVREALLRGPRGRGRARWARRSAPARAPRSRRRAAASTRSTARSAADRSCNQPEGGGEGSFPSAASSTAASAAASVSSDDRSPCSAVRSAAAARTSSAEPASRSAAAASRATSPALAPARREGARSAPGDAAPASRTRRHATASAECGALRAAPARPARAFCGARAPRQPGPAAAAASAQPACQARARAAACRAASCGSEANQPGGMSAGRCASTASSPASTARRTRVPAAGRAGVPRTPPRRTRAARPARPRASPAPRARAARPRRSRPQRWRRARRRPRRARPPPTCLAAAGPARGPRRAAGTPTQPAPGGGAAGRRSDRAGGAASGRRARPAARSSPARRRSARRAAARRRRGRSDVSEGAGLGRRSSEAPSAVATAARVVLCECSSSTYSSSPTCASRLCTTSSAAAFSDTNRTVFPCVISSAIMFAIVWLLPVPGGPSITNERPSRAAATHWRWEASASRIVTACSGGNASSNDASATGAKSNVASPSGPAASALTIGCAAISSKFSRRSRYIASLWKENVDSTTRSSTDHGGCSATAARIASSSGATSSGSSGSSSGSSIPRSFSSLSHSAGLTSDSSSVGSSFQIAPAREDSSRTGTSSSGLSWNSARPSAGSDQCRIPTPEVQDPDAAVHELARRPPRQPGARRAHLLARRLRRRQQRRRRPPRRQRTPSTRRRAGTNGRPLRRRPARPGRPRAARRRSARRA